MGSSQNVVHMKVSRRFTNILVSRFQICQIGVTSVVALSMPPVSPPACSSPYERMLVHRVLSSISCWTMAFSRGETSEGPVSCCVPNITPIIPTYCREAPQSLSAHPTIASSGRQSTSAMPICYGISTAMTPLPMLSRKLFVQRRNTRWPGAATACLNCITEPATSPECGHWRLR